MASYDTASKVIPQYDCIVIGGGIVGLALARHYALASYKVALLEAKPSIGQEASFRNSAVIHAGLYYPQNSLKSKLCLRGQSLIYDYCLEKSIPYKAIGKLIVAIDDAQLNTLVELQQAGLQNGVTNLHLIDEAGLHTMEPTVRGVAALFSPDTATIDGQQLLQALARDFLDAQGHLFTAAAVTQCIIKADSFTVYTTHSCLPRITSPLLINAGGLSAQKIARSMIGLSPSTIPPLYLAKGNYFKYLHPTPFKHLIYPIPERAGLGIHATIDIHGNMRFGPDVEWVEELSFTTTISRKQHFVTQIKSYFPDLDEEALIPDDQYTGIRPKISPPQSQPQDFLIQTSQVHGINKLVQLYGIESPGLTASLAIAEYIYQMER